MPGTTSPPPPCSVWVCLGVLVFLLVAFVVVVVVVVVVSREGSIFAVVGRLRAKRRSTFGAMVLGERRVVGGT